MSRCTALISNTELVIGVGSDSKMIKSSIGSANLTTNDGHEELQALADLKLEISGEDVESKNNCKSSSPSSFSKSASACNSSCPSLVVKFADPILLFIILLSLPIPISETI